MTAKEQYIKELQKATNELWSRLYPPASEERLREIMEASNHVELDEYNPDREWKFQQGDSPFDWYDAQVAAINYFGHIFCINPFYDNFDKYTFDGRLKTDDSPKFYGFEFDSSEELLNYLNSSAANKKYLDMAIKTIAYLKLNFNMEFPNKWADQFPQKLLSEQN